jgi:dTDP-4-amino-4,6-dideoxygalactose transaminase
MSGVNKRVPFLDLSAEFRGLEAEWLETIRASGQAGSFILGPQVNALEREIADYVGVGHAIAVANGTDSLVLSLRALDIGPGDEVITTPFTFFATAEAITVVGAKVVFADILPECYTLDPASVRACITERTRAIMPVHLFGHPARMDEIEQIARQHGLAVIEDCAQAFGAQVGGRRVGSIGDTGSFSFYPTKVLGCYGDGGMITTNRADVAERLRRLRNHGAIQPFIHTEIGYNSRLDEIQAALLRIKLRSIDEAIAGRRAVATQYHRELAGLPLRLPSEPQAQGHVFNLYTMRSDRRDALRTVLGAHEVACNVCYPVPLHLQKVYEGLGYQVGSLPVAEKAAREVLSLPIYPGMPVANVARVGEVLRAAL